MSNIHQDLRYTKSHEWVKIDDNVATVGITDHAQHMLGDLVYVDLPQAGDITAKGDDVAAVESVKTASDIYSPISGKIIEVNKILTENPNVISEDPYDKGWLFKVELLKQDELNTLLDAPAYKTLIKHEID